ncbi:hypothetical protein ACMBCN_02540 [Candidatus Liberibacter asiaticus]
MCLKLQERKTRKERKKRKKKKKKRVLPLLMLKLLVCLFECFSYCGVFLFKNILHCICNF